MKTFLASTHGLKFIQHDLKKELLRQGIQLTCCTANQITKEPPNNKAVGYQMKHWCLQDKMQYRLQQDFIYSVYIGQSGHVFMTRYKAKPIPSANKQRSTFDKHLVDFNHYMSNKNEDLEIMDLLGTLEEYEILIRYNSSCVSVDDNAIVNVSWSICMCIVCVFNLM